ncbi:MAG TPA: hypothetical protein VL651_10815 [Bacteroidia bacterium]|jgi:hypothetical protein|nr:hypothetical protein [Bacteroidia bacterium]
MYLTIFDHETISQVRKKFSAEFPFLRIDFFRPLAENVPYSALRVMDEDAEIGSLRKKHNSGAISISPSDITGEVENKFLDLFGLHIQIFRRSGNTWLLTTTTDAMTLQQQNALGEEMHTSVPQPEPEDIHEHE